MLRKVSLCPPMLLLCQVLRLFVPPVAARTLPAASDEAGRERERRRRVRSSGGGGALGRQHSNSNSSSISLPSLPQEPAGASVFRDDPVVNDARSRRRARDGAPRRSDRAAAPAMASRASAGAIHPISFSLHAPTMVSLFYLPFHIVRILLTI